MGTKLCVFLGFILIGFVQAVPKEALLSDDYIVSGIPAKSNQFPFLVSIRIGTVHYCAGSIINPKWILTAAYCKFDIPLEQYTIIAGISKLNSAGDEYKIDAFLQHPGYNVSHHDLALLRLKNEIKFRPSVEAASLPTVDIAPHEYLFASGWGYTKSPSTTPNDLMYIYMVTYDKHRCGMELAGIDEGHLCTYSKKGFGVCSGDSGGPLTAGRVIYGITVWKKPCVIDVLPFVFTRVYKYVDWIQTTAIY